MTFNVFIYISAIYEHKDNGKIANEAFGKYVHSILELTYPFLSYEICKLMTWDLFILHAPSFLIALGLPW
jgi:hypothetical protein